MSPLPFTAILIAALAFQACASVENVIVAEPGLAFTLPVGKTATVTGSPSRITFTHVREDSRCPINVVCVWEGAAKIEVAVSRTGSPVQSAILSLSTPDNETRVGDLVVRFVGLAPAPVSPQPAQRQYVAELVVSRLQ